MMRTLSHRQRAAHNAHDRPAVGYNNVNARRVTLNPPCRVILNDRVLFRPLTGVGHYTRQLLTALTATPDGPDAANVVEMRPFLTTLIGESHRPAPADAPAETPPQHKAPAPQKRAGRLAPALRQLLEIPYRFAFRLAAGRCQLYHEPNHIPIRCAIPTVTTIHDLSVIEHPEWHPADRVRWYDREFDAGLRQSCRFIAASEYTKQQMVARLNIAADKIDVTYQAPRPAFTPQPTARSNAARERLHLPAQFFLFVGTLEPRKNVPGLLEAYAHLDLPLRNRFPLVLAGGWGWKMDQLATLIDQFRLRDHVRLVGYLSDPTLAALYSCATALVWPTRYEGFGLPPLEAMACGCPVIVSGVSSLPEVVGDAGILLDPDDTPAWTAAMQHIAEDSVWRANWQQRSLERSATFSWRRCARQTAACYRLACQSA